MSILQRNSFFYVVYKDLKTNKFEMISVRGFNALENRPIIRKLRISYNGTGLACHAVCHETHDHENFYRQFRKNAQQYLITAIHLDTIVCKYFYSWTQTPRCCKIQVFVKNTWPHGHTPVLKKNFSPVFCKIS